jgi:chaperonin cofactor prefoldin
MAEENISEDRFKSEVMRLLNALMLKVDAHDKRFDTLENKFDAFEKKFDTLSAQVTEIGLKTQIKKFRA